MQSWPDRHGLIVQLARHPGPSVVDPGHSDVSTNFPEMNSFVANSAFHPSGSGVGKSSTSLSGWG